MKTFQAKLLADVDHQTSGVYEDISRIKDDLKDLQEAYSQLERTSVIIDLNSHTSCLN